jgi:hypothetical protein
MALPIRKIGHSLLESLLYLAVLGASSAFLGFFPAITKRIDIPPYVYLPVMTAMASAVVAFAFPKPNFIQAFLKLFIGGIFTFLIFLVLLLSLGPIVFEVILGFFWDAGAAVWDWTSATSIVAAIFSLLIYIFITLVIVGLVFAGLFAITHVIVLMVMNLFIKRNIADEDENLMPPKSPPFT